MVWAVMKALHASINAMSATSSISPKRLAGIISGLATGFETTISVATSAGVMALTVMPSFANTRA
jgi:hypothetical protein